MIGLLAFGSIGGAVALHGNPDLAMLPICALPVALLVMLRQRDEVVDPLHGHHGWRELEAWRGEPEVKAVADQLADYRLQ